MAIAVQTDMATPSLHRFGSDELKERYLAPAIRGEMVAAIAVTEPDAGSDVAGLRTRAVRDGDELGDQRLASSTSPTAPRPTGCACWRAPSDEGGARGHEPDRRPDRHARVRGLAASSTSWATGARTPPSWSSTDVRVPVSQHDRRGRPRLPAADGAVPERADDRLLRPVGAVRARPRPHAGVPARAARRSAGRCSTTSTCSTSWPSCTPRSTCAAHYNYACAEAYVARRGHHRFATIAKLGGRPALRGVADTCLQFHGGIGYMEETWTARFFRDMRITPGRRPAHALARARPRRRVRRHAGRPAPRAAPGNRRRRRAAPRSRWPGTS